MPNFLKPAKLPRNPSRWDFLRAQGIKEHNKREKFWWVLALVLISAALLWFNFGENIYRHTHPDVVPQEEVYNPSEILATSTDVTFANYAVLRLADGSHEHFKLGAFTVTGELYQTAGTSYIRDDEGNRLPSRSIGINYNLANGRCKARFSSGGSDIYGTVSQSNDDPVVYITLENGQEIVIKQEQVFDSPAAQQPGEGSEYLAPVTLSGDGLVEALFGEKTSPEEIFPRPKEITTAVDDYPRILGGNFNVYLHYAGKRYPVTDLTGSREEGYLFYLNGDDRRRDEGDSTYVMGHDPYGVPMAKRKLRHSNRAMWCRIEDGGGKLNLGWEESLPLVEGVVATHVACTAKDEKGNIVTFSTKVKPATPKPKRK